MSKSLSIISSLVIPLLLSGCGLPQDSSPGGVGESTHAVNNFTGIILPPLPGLGGGGGGGGGGGHGSLSADPGLVYFGQVCPDDSASKNLTLRNSGTGDVQVNNLSISNSAFSLIDAPTLPLTVRAGGSSSLELGFKAPSNNGSNYQVTGNLRVSSNAPGSSNLTVQLVGFVPPATLALSRHTIDLGDQLVGDAVTATLTVTDNGQCQTKITGYRTEGDGASQLTVSGLPSRPLQSGDSADVKVTFLCEQDGDFDVTLRFLGPQGSLASADVLVSCFAL